MLLLLETDKGFSSHYFSFVIEKLSPKREAAFKKAESLTRDYLQRSLSIADLKNTESFSLDSHWKLSLRTGLEQPEDIRKEYWDAINFYKRIKDEQFYRLRDKIATDLKTHLRKGFTDKADIFGA